MNIRVSAVLFFIIALVPFQSSWPEAGTNFTIESLPLSNDVVSVNSTENHTWWVSTNTDINIQTLTQNLSANTEANQIDSPGVDWLAAPLPGNVIKLGIIPKDTQRAIFMRRFFLSQNEPNQNYAVRLGKISDRDKVYFNGVLIGASGEFNSKRPQSYDKIRLYEIPTQLLRPGKINVIVIDTEKYFDFEIGVVADRIEFGPELTIYREFFYDLLIQLLLLASYVTVGVYFLFLFIRRPQEKANLVFAIFALSLVGYQALSTQLKHEIGLSFFPMKKIEYLVLQMMVGSIYLFIRTYFGLPKKWFFKVLDYVSWAAIAGLTFVFFAVLFTNDIQFWNTVNQGISINIVLPIIMLSIIIVTAYHMIKKNVDAWIMFSGVLIMATAAVLDALSNKQVINTPRVAGYAFFFFIVLLALILANKFVRVHKEVEFLNRNLEKKVDERTAELHESLDTVNALKVQQDGDYFLTSLLIDPLSTIRSSSEAVQIESLLYQKKDFSFKKWSKRLGGDLCVSDSLTLRNRPVTVFMNADAMGKSMQGAGGVLVLGSVLSAILERTRMSSRMADLYPEEWLRDAFRELNRVFESFNGSMMVSLVMGVIDDLTGNLFFINAEHPFTVIYRNGKASFIEEEMQLRKLGTVGIKGRLKIVTFHLQPGDVIIAGSDGRDDVVLSEDGKGNRVINEDEMLFLHHVEAANGQLKEIKDEILKTGALMDDLSLLRVSYQGVELPEGEIVNVDEQHGKTMAQLIEMAERNDSSLESAMISFLRNDLNPISQVVNGIRSLIRSRKWDAAARLADVTQNHASRNVEILYLASYTQKLVNNFQRAMQLAELLYLHEPELVRNLINLADIALMLDDVELADRYIKEVEEIDNNNEKLNRLRTAFQKKVEQRSSPLS